MLKVRKKIDFSGQKIYVGIDVHKTKWAVCVCTDQTNYRPFSQGADPEILISYLNREFPKGKYICAYEAGFSGFGLYEALWEASIECLVVHPADIPTTHKEAEFKHDKIDALKIAKTLRSGDLVSIAIPDKQLQEDRSLIRFRQQLRKDLVRQKCRIKSFLDFYSILIPKQWTKAKWPIPMRMWLWQLKLTTDQGTKTLRLQMGRLEYIIGMCKNTDNHLKELSRTPRHEKKVELLMTVVGFGRIRAIDFLVQLGDINRFSTLDKLANYFGLVPSSHNSADIVKQYRLTYRGHKQLRTLMVEAAWTSINTDPAMAQKYANLKKRMLPQEAIIGVARSLLSRVRYVLIHQVPYQKGIVA